MPTPRPATDHLTAEDLQDLPLRETVRAFNDLTIDQLAVPNRVRIKVGKRYVQITVTRVTDIGQGMVLVHYRNSEVPYRVPADTVVTILAGVTGK